jgi:glycerophosphoryl diester phosphodiesterase
VIDDAGMRLWLIAVGLLVGCSWAAGDTLQSPRAHGSGEAVAPGAAGEPAARPLALLGQLTDGPLKQRLEACRGVPLQTTLFSIAHRGAPLGYPEHTREGYEAAVRMGAGIVECDVNVTRDRELVCRHAACDLHATTNILATPLAARCSQPFVPASGDRPASARCCTTDLTLAEFKQLRGRMDSVDPQARSVAEYIAGPRTARPVAGLDSGTVMSHRESIALFQQLGVGMAPELKTPEVVLPFDAAYTRARYAQQLIDEYKSAGVPPGRVWPQSFDEAALRLWLEHEPAYARQAVALVSLRSALDLQAAQARLEPLRALGLNYLAPPLWALVTLDTQGAIVPSAYARAARRSGFGLIGWTLERSGNLADGGGYYFQSVRRAIQGPADYLRLMHVLAEDVGVVGLFSDWPATVSYYAGCTGRK